MMGRDFPTPFALVRTADPSGVSGVGTVAMGVIWPDQRVAVRWAGHRPPTGYHTPVRQLCLFDHVDEIEGIHGHNGHTFMQRRDPMSGCGDLGMDVFGIVGTYGLRREIAYWGLAFHDGPVVTWRAHSDGFPPRVEQWPSGVTRAWEELRDEETSADEVAFAWVPSQADALMHAHPANKLTGRRRLVRRHGVSKSPHRR